MIVIMIDMLLKIRSSKFPCTRMFVDCVLMNDDIFGSSFPLEDGMRVMVDLLKSHKHDLQVVRAAIQALAGLTMDLESPKREKNEGNQSRLVALGTVPLLSEMMIDHPTSDDLQQSVCMMVSALCRRNSINAKLLGENRMIECVISALKPMLTNQLF